MGQANFVQTSFLGGEVSQSYQGRIDRNDYRTFMNLCLNTVPVESGAALRRGGTRHVAPMRGGAPGRVIAFDFKEAFPYNMVFTDGVVRFQKGTELAITDRQQVVTVSTGTPAVVTTVARHGWGNGNSGFFQNLIGNEQLQNRVFSIIVTSDFTFELYDGISGAAIVGGTLGAFFSGYFCRIHEVETSYRGGTWSTLRAVQSERQVVLLNGTAPQVLSVARDPTALQDALFALNPASFIDGPYLDPIPGSWVTSSQLNGVTTLTLTFQPYDAGRAYQKGDYAESGGANYRSLVDSNQGNAPAGSPGSWLAVNGGDPINNGAGFSAADIGRLLRLYSEPVLWDSVTAFGTNAVIAYQDGGANSAASYWKNTSGGTLTGVVPGTTTGWSPIAPGAIWTWAKILSIANTGAVAPDSTIGSMSGGGGTASAFDGNTSKAMASAASISGSTQTASAWQPIFYPIGSQLQYQFVIWQKVNQSQATFPPSPIPAGYETVPPPSNPLWLAVGATANLTVNGYVGGHFAAGKIVQSVTVFPSSDNGFSSGVPLVLNLRGKASLPANAADGTLLGSTGSFGDGLSAVVIGSNDNATAWNYIWVEGTASYLQPLPDNGTHLYTGTIGIAQIVVYSPNVANGSVISAQILGDPLLYATAIRKWRLGAYGGATGWPACGVFHEGRLWLSGAIDNRLDGGKPIDTNGHLFNFAPTAPNGTVSDDNAITARFDSKDVNAIFWMETDEQGIICGTQAGEWLVTPAAQGAISPTNISAKRRTKVGCANIEPRRTDHTLVFVQKFQRKLMEYFADVYSGKMSAPNLTLKSKHLTTSGIAEIAYQQELAPTVWSRLVSGGLVGMTYKRDKLTTAQEPEIAAAHRVILGTARTVESICVGPATGGNIDALTLVTNDPNTGIRHLEVMTNLLDEGFAMTDVWALDNAIRPTSTAGVNDGSPYLALRINGLWAHNGQTVAVYVGGLDCGQTTDANGLPIVRDFVVTDGSITVPFGDGVSAGTGFGLFTQDFLRSFSPTLDPAVLPIVVGFPFTSRGQVVRAAQPSESGSRTGPSFGQERRTDRLPVLLYGALDATISFGTSFDAMIPFEAKLPNGAAYTKLQQWSGIYRLPINADEDFDNMLCWEMTRPNAAAFVIAIGGRLQTQE